MIHLFLNGLATSAGGGLTYLRNFIPQVSARSDLQVTVAVTPAVRREFGELRGLSFPEIEGRSGATLRSWQEQAVLPRLIRRSRADVLISTGNFALWRSPVPQILLSRNALYISAEFFRDLRARRDYRLWLDTRLKGWLARQSIRRADCTVAPSEAFAEVLRRWSGASVVTIHHGFDHEAFFRDSSPLPAETQQRLDSARDSLRLLFVSHYNYYRNFETFLRAVPLLRERLKPRKVKLFLTCRLRSEDNPGTYRAEAASALVSRLGIAEEVVELGAVPHHLLHHVYGVSDIYVTPAYAESFAHPLVEAMASGLPIVASDIAVHREVCRQAAVYFDRFSPEELCEQVLRVALSDNFARDLASRGLVRSREFSWQKHVDQMIALAGKLVAQRASDNRSTQ